MVSRHKTSLILSLRFDGRCSTYLEVASWLREPEGVRTNSKSYLKLFPEEEELEYYCISLKSCEKILLT